MLLTRSTCLLRAYILSASSRRTRLEVLQRGAHEGRPLARLHLRVQGMCVCLCVCMCTCMCGVHKANWERCVCPGIPLLLWQSPSPREED